MNTTLHMIGVSAGDATLIEHEDDGRKIPILHFQKAGYDKLLYLLVKEIDGR